MRLGVLIPVQSKPTSYHLPHVSIPAQTVWMLLNRHAASGLYDPVLLPGLRDPLPLRRRRLLLPP